MAKPLSLDLRMRIAEALDLGQETWQGIADRFGVGIASVNRIARRWRKGHNLTPRAHGGGRAPSIPDDHLPTLRALIDEAPDRTLAELREAWRSRTGVWVGHSTMWRAVARLDYTLKKRPLSPLSETAQKSPPSEPTSSYTPSR